MSLGEERDLDKAVYEAVEWYVAHPGRDHVDAAYAVAASIERHPAGQKYSTGRWPEFVEAVKNAVTNLPAVS